MKKVLSLGVLALLGIGFSFAHQPRIVREQVNPASNPIIVSNPEISQAFYGILSGQADHYQIISDTGFLLYVNLVVPDLSGSRTDFAVSIAEGDKLLKKLEGATYSWGKFYEEFAGDMYLSGPSREKVVGPGVYSIQVSNLGNTGKYSLAIGKLESFPLGESLKTLARLPVLKVHFFEKSFFAIWEGKIIQYLTYGILAIIIIILMIIRTVERLRK